MFSYYCCYCCFLNSFYSEDLMPLGVLVVVYHATAAGGRPKDTPAVIIHVRFFQAVIVIPDDKAGPLRPCLSERFRES